MNITIEHKTQTHARGLCEHRFWRARYSPETGTTILGDDTNENLSAAMRTAIYHKLQEEAPHLTPLQPAKLKAFVAEILKVCRKHNISIGHEDDHGAFEFHGYEPLYDQWLEESLATMLSRHPKDST